MDKDKLETILQEHKKWAAGEGGKRASLRGANLRGANLRGANLRGADLRGADLREADLREANLGGADLGGADLGGAALRGADLREAIINWMSHTLVSELLMRVAGDSIELRMVAGLIAVSTDWCWEKFLSVETPHRDWALAELRKWVRDGDNAPEILRGNYGND
jgi:uncharacterized protein YjbI with pentapeptide repeats